MTPAEAMARQMHDSLGDYFRQRMPRLVHPGDLHFDQLSGEAKRRYLFVCEALIAAGWVREPVYKLTWGKFDIPIPADEPKIVGEGER